MSPSPASGDHPPAPGASQDCGLRDFVQALAFAARKHRGQRRKGAGAPPFIDHAIEVAALLALHAGVTDPITLQAAILHDTLEDTDTTPGELEALFGPEVRGAVEEVSDDRGLSKPERRRQQILGAPRLSERAKLIRLADKIANVRAVTSAPPADWSVDRRRDYLNWTEEVIAGCRGCSAELERLYDEALRVGWETIQ